MALGAFGFVFTGFGSRDLGFGLSRAVGFRLGVQFSGIRGLRLNGFEVLK